MRLGKPEIKIRMFSIKACRPRVAIPAAALLLLLNVFHNNNGYLACTQKLHNNTKKPQEKV